MRSMLTPHCREGVFEADAVAVGAAAVGFDGVGSGEGGRAEETASETCAFFVGPVDEADRDRAVCR